MKLFLASYRIQAPKELATLVGKKPTATRVALIPNAQDYYATRARGIKIQEVQAYLEGFGYKTEVVDLRDFKQGAVLQERLLGYDMLWMAGGNTFCLRYEMRRSGFETIAKDLLEAGVVYGGESAGAVVAGTSLHGIENMDEPAFAEAVIWKGLNLVPKFVLPHSDNLEYADAIPAVLEQYQNNSDMVLLKDSEALVVDGEIRRVVAAEL